MSDIGQRVEQILLNKVKLVGENEQTYIGYPAELIKEYTALASDVDREARVQEIEACLELFISTPTHEFVKNLNSRLEALAVESLESK